MIRELCRLCGKKSDNMACIFGNLCEIQQIHLKIEKVLHINIKKEDILPTLVCHECINRLDKAFRFIIFCHETQRILEEIYKQKDSSLHCEKRIPPNDLSLELKHINLNNGSKMTEKTGVSDDDDNKKNNSTENLPLRIDSSICGEKAVSVFGKQNVVQISAEKYSKLDCSFMLIPKRKRMKIDDPVIFNDDAKQKISENKSRLDAKEENGSAPVRTVNLNNVFDDLVSEFSIKGNGNDDNDDSEYCIKAGKKNSNKKQKSRCKTLLSKKINKNFVKKSVILIKPGSDLIITSKDSVTNISQKEFIKERKKLVCDTCSMSFSQELTYQEHLNVHTGNRPFSCKLCEASFRKRQERNQHLRTVHSDKQFKCNLCEHVAKHKGKLTEHMKSVHEKPFTCDQCNYRTGEKGKIQQHIANKHNGDLSYVCEICGNGFRTKTSLQTHRQNIHFPEPKICQTCGTLCPSLARYSAHIFRCGKEKRRYPCEKCGQSYVNKEILKDHMNKHLNIKPYKCNICSKEFFQRNRLDTHKYVHRGAAYRCEICNQGFNRKDNMKNHMKKHFYKSLRFEDVIVTAV